MAKAVKKTAPYKAKDLAKAGQAWRENLAASAQDYIDAGVTRGTSLPILATAQGITESLDIAPKRFHRINVRADGDKFRLYDFAAVCGPRLLKGDDPSPPPEQFLAIHRDPFLFDLIEEATESAQKLQDYLDEYENPKLAAYRNRNNRNSRTQLRSQ